MTYFSGLKFFGCFEKHVSGALRDDFRAREVFGSFEKWTLGLVNALTAVKLLGTRLARMGFTHFRLLSHFSLPTISIVNLLHVSHLEFGTKSSNCVSTKVLLSSFAA